MSKAAKSFVICGLMFILLAPPNARSYSMDYLAPQSGGCPVPAKASFSASSPLNRQWSTSLPVSAQTVLTVAPPSSGAQITEIAQAISDSFGAWAGVSGTTLNASSFPGNMAALAQVPSATACTDDAEENIDALNTICFNASSDAFDTGVLAFTRVITANAPGAVAGASAPAVFAGQILDSDTLFRNDGQASFATPAALSTSAGQGAYDLESILIHELGEWFGLDSSAVCRSAMFPFAPPPGQFLGDRPTAEAPDGPLSDDDRTGLRTLYPDANDTVDVGAIRGRIVPANLFSLAAAQQMSPSAAVTGIIGAQVVAVDAASGSIVAGVLAGFSCGPSTGTIAYDGTYDMERLPIGRQYSLYAEPLVGLAAPESFSGVFAGLCSLSGCGTPSFDVQFDPRFLNGP